MNIYPDCCVFLRCVQNFCCAFYKTASKTFIALNHISSKFTISRRVRLVDWLLSPFLYPYPIDVVAVAFFSSYITAFLEIVVKELSMRQILNAPEKDRIPSGTSTHTDTNKRSERDVCIISIRYILYAHMC